MVPIVQTEFTSLNALRSKGYYTQSKLSVFTFFLALIDSTGCQRLQRWLAFCIPALGAGGDGCIAGCSAQCSFGHPQNLLLFQAAPASFDVDIIVTAAFAGHANQNAEAFSHF